MTGRISIKKIIRTTTEGRKTETPEDYYACWCNVNDLNTAEKYSALQTELNETIVFKVRMCKKIETVMLNTKDYKVIYNGNEYNIYAATPMYTDNRRVILKCNKVS